MPPSTPLFPLAKRWLIRLYPPGRRLEHSPEKFGYPKKIGQKKHFWGFFVVKTVHPKVSHGLKASYQFHFFSSLL